MPHHHTPALVYLWLIGLGAVGFVLAGYFHSRALKLIDDDGPMEFMDNWKFRTQLAATTGLAWFIAGIAGLTGSSWSGVLTIGGILSMTPIIVRTVASSYAEHRHVQQRRSTATTSL